MPFPPPRSRARSLAICLPVALATLLLAPFLLAPAAGSSTPAALSTPASSTRATGAAATSHVSAATTASHPDLTWVADRFPAVAGDLATILGISCATVDDCTVLASTGPRKPAFALTTENGGFSWAEQSLPDAPDLQALSCTGAPPASCWTVGTLSGNNGNGGGVIVSDVSGRWTAQTVPAGVSDLSGISCTTTADCVAVGTTGDNFDPESLVTTDGGTAWTAYPVVSAAEQLVAVSSASTTTCTAVGSFGVTGNGGVILQTTDGGVQWSDQYKTAHGYGAPPLDAVSCPSVQTCYVVGELENQASTPTGAVILATGDEGTNWASQTPPAGVAGLVAVSCPSAAVCWAGGRDGSNGPTSILADTQDGGTTWSIDGASPPASSPALDCPSVTTCVAASVPTADAAGVIWSREAGVPSSCNGSLPAGTAVGLAAIGGNQGDVVDPGGDGYWLASSTLGTVACGTAPEYALPGLREGSSPIVAIAAVPDGCGYYELARNGTVYPFGACAQAFPRVHSAAPFVGITIGPNGQGYWLVSADGGVFSEGGLPYRGSLPGSGITTDQVVGIATGTANGTGEGYWLVTSDGSVYTYGLRFRGSLPGLGVHVDDVVGMAGAPDGAGYYLLGADGGVFDLAEGVPFCGSAAGRTHSAAVSITADPFSEGYWIVERDGAVDSIDAPYVGDGWPQTGFHSGCGS